MEKACLKDKDGTTYEIEVLQDHVEVNSNTGCFMQELRVTWTREDGKSVTHDVYAKLDIDRINVRVRNVEEQMNKKRYLENVLDMLSIRRVRKIYDRYNKGKWDGSENKPKSHKYDGIYIGDITHDGAKYKIKFDENKVDYASRIFDISHDIKASEEVIKDLIAEIQKLQGVEENTGSSQEVSEIDAMLKDLEEMRVQQRSGVENIEGDLNEFGERKSTNKVVVSKRENEFSKNETIRRSIRGGLHFKTIKNLEVEIEKEKRNVINLKRKLVLAQCGEYGYNKKLGQNVLNHVERESQENNTPEEKEH